ncbi:MAG TPA: sigma 54-interacting transcriptional regulator, partial [Candidatus Krumholzibacterium sp.]|nr:sigma 54-interacting transcriptional regulator [Candidatus Krumholzibacterium sp.]
MNSEIWTLVQSENIETLVEQLVINERMKLRRFRNVSEVLNAEEPSGGMILVIDSTDGYQNFGQIIKRIEKNFINFEVMVFTGDEELGDAGRDSSAGVDMFVPVPVDEDDFQVRAAHVISLRRVKDSAGIVGRSAPLREVLETIIHVAPTEVSVLIEGESGSGKELIAKAIHARS